MFSNGTYFAKIYPMDKKSDAGKSLKMLVVEFFSPGEMTVDGSKMQNSPGNEFMKCCWMNDI